MSSSLMNGEQYCLFSVSRDLNHTLREVTAHCEENGSRQCKLLPHWLAGTQEGVTMVMCDFSYSMTGLPWGQL